MLRVKGVMSLIYDTQQAHRNMHYGLMDIQACSDILTF